MLNGKLLRYAGISVCTMAVALLGTGATQPEIDDFLVRMQDSDGEVRCAAWQVAGPMGAGAVGPLADLMAGGDQGISRAATEGLHKITHHAGRPDAPATERKAVVAELVKLLDPKRPNSVRHESLHLLSLIGDEEAVKAIAPILDDIELRDAARTVLQRIPVEAATQALIAALDKAPTDFKSRIMESLGQRGDAAAVKPLMKAVDTPDMTVGDAAISALARIGEPAGDIFTPDTIAKLSDDGLDRLGDAYLRYAGRRAARGDQAAAVGIYNALLQRARREHHQRAAKIGLGRSDSSSAVSSRPSDAAADLSK